MQCRSALYENICTFLNARALTVWRRKLDVTKESSCASVTNKFHSGKLCSGPPTKFFPYADGLKLGYISAFLSPDRSTVGEIRKNQTRNSRIQLHKGGFFLWRPVLVKIVIIKLLHKSVFPATSLHFISLLCIFISSTFFFEVVAYYFLET